MEKNPLRVYNSTLDMIGSTPMLRLNNLTKKHNIKCQVFIKLEAYNPGKSVKDRISLHMIEEAEKKNKLKKGQKIVEASSGNTGMGITMVAKLKGYEPIICVNSRMSSEKLSRQKVFDTKVHVRPVGVDPFGPYGHKKLAEDIEKNENAYHPNQYENQENPESHYQTTGKEIYEQMEGQLDYFIAGAGTGGTISGTGKFLKEKIPSIKVIGVDVRGSILAKPDSLNKEEPHLYLVEGIGEKEVPSTLNRDVIDEWIKVNDKESFQMAREIIQIEGAFIGGSCGGALQGAFKYLKDNNLNENQDLKIVVIMPDSLDSYTSKFVKLEWMVGCGYEQPECLSDKKNLLYKFSAKDFQFLNAVKTIKDDEDFTIQNAIDIFKQGIKGIPILKDNKIDSCIDIQSVQKLIVVTGMQPDDDAKQLLTVDSLSLPYEVNFSIVHRMLEDFQYVFLIKKNNDKIEEVYIVDQLDMIKCYEQVIKNN